MVEFLNLPKLVVPPEVITLLIRGLKTPEEAAAAFPEMTVAQFVAIKNGLKKVIRRAGVFYIDQSAPLTAEERQARRRGNG